MVNPFRLGARIFGATLARPDATRLLSKGARLSAVGKLPSGAGITTGSIGPGTTIRPGDKLTILHVHLPGLPLPAVLRHALVLDFCYCSLNGSCWTLHADTESEESAADRKPVSRCTTSAAISRIVCLRPLLSRPRRK